jgi:hypothetical protein
MGISRHLVEQLTKRLTIRLYHAHNITQEGAHNDVPDQRRCIRYLKGGRMTVVARLYDRLLRKTCVEQIVTIEIALSVWNYLPLVLPVISWTSRRCVSRTIVERHNGYRSVGISPNGHLLITTSATFTHLKNQSRPLADHSYCSSGNIPDSLIFEEC